MSLAQQGVWRGLGVFGQVQWKELQAWLQAQGVQPEVVDAIAPLLSQAVGRDATDPLVPSMPSLGLSRGTFRERGAGLSMALQLDEEPPTQVRSSHHSPHAPGIRDTDKIALPERGLADLTVAMPEGVPTIERGFESAFADPFLQPQRTIEQLERLDQEPTSFEPTARLRPPGIKKSLRPKAMRTAESADTRVMGAPSQEDIYSYQESLHGFDDLDLHDPTIVVGLPRGDEPSASASGAPSSQERGPLRESQVFESAAERYKDLGLIGLGGMGEIRRMLDRNLNRVVAMKLLKREYLRDRDMIERFFEEAQVTAQLEHPGIIPTHEIGRWVDGRIYFTMREIRGQTLAQVLKMSQPAFDTKRHKSRPSSWSLRRLLNLFQRACEAVGYAHDRGVVHRDIKPANMIVGAHGEIQVVDWGLVKRLIPKSDALPEGKAVSFQGEHPDKTSSGILLGTPRYMAPEQILHPDDVDERSDVYALGIILYEILAGRTPYQDKSVKKILMKKMQGFPIPPGRTASDELPEPWAPLPRDFSMDELLTLPDGLMEICATALAPEPIDRYPNAGALAKVIEGWLAGLQKRRRAQELVSRAADKVEQERGLRDQVQQLRQEAQELGQRLEGWEPEEEKWVMWNKDAEAAILEQRAESLLIESIQLLQGALTHEPELVEAHLALASRYHQQHKAAEARRDSSRLLHAEARLRQHVAALPSDHQLRHEYETYLRGDGWLTLDTEPPGAMVSVARYEPKGRRLVEVSMLQPMMTPIVDLALPYGRYILRIQADGCAEVSYPIQIERGKQWSTEAPDVDGASSSDVLGTTPVSLPWDEEIGEGECFVPAGWCLVGGDPDKDIPPSRVWVDDFIIQQHPVTNQQYLDFLNAIVAQGREAEALRCVPREKAGGIDEVGAMIYGRLDDGSFFLRTDADGDTWQPDWPVVMVDWHGAVAYTRWLRRQTGLPWRLPWEVEWEKAARGTDGRLYPWGDAFDPSWCCMRQSRRETHMIGPIDEFPIDQSVYGVCGMGGNVSDWCLDLFTKGALFVDNRRFIPPENQHRAERRRRVMRGGNWGSEAFAVRFSFRSGFRENTRHTGCGIRLVRPLKPNTNHSFIHSQAFKAPKRLF